jgi:hypothetical protein
VSSTADAATVILSIDTLAHLARDQARDDEQPGDLIDQRAIGAWRADVLLPGRTKYSPARHSRNDTAAPPPSRS